MIHLNEKEIKSVLNWNDVFAATEVAMKAVSTGKAQLSSRIFTPIFDTPKWMTAMPGFLEDEKYGGWACKILSCNPENRQGPNPISASNATVILLDQNTGVLKAVFAGEEITNWRTAAASAVATKFLHKSVSKPENFLSIFGCGQQGKAHAECFYHCFQFDEIRLWNRTSQRATDLANELNESLGTTKFQAYKDTESCTRGADVIVTATSPGVSPLVKYAWLQQGVHINVVGVIGSSSANERNYEVDEETYKNAHVYVDSWHGANTELKKLKEYGANIKAEVGEVISLKVPKPEKEDLTIFQSLGMAAEDCAMARLIYDLHIQKLNRQN